MVSIAWVFFRAENIGKAAEYFSIIFSEPLHWPEGNKKSAIIGSLTLISIDWIITRYHKTHITDFYNVLIIGVLLFLLVFIDHSHTGTDFIYFQF